MTNPLSLVGYCSYSGIYSNFGTTQADLVCISSGISAESSVFAAISQTDLSGHRFLGGTTMWVENIVPINGEVKVRVNLGSEGPINVRLDILVSQ